MRSDLIYDVGVNDGADTAYYLHKGFHVVGIEASPIAVTSLRERFESQIESGSLTLLNIGIAEVEGKFPFWVCDDHPEWSSFHRSIASRGGCRHHAEMVQTRSFADVISEHGIPHFCKIDIEGNDKLCLNGLSPDTAPRYISIELNPKTEDGIGLLHDLGYREFKIISQNTWAQPSPWLSSFILNLPAPLMYRSMRLERMVRGNLRDADWQFPLGSSGPFGEATHGAWISRERAVDIWRLLRGLNAKWKRDGGGDWYDIHARRTGVAQ